jgi:hypothetical protein
MLILTKIIVVRVVLMEVEVERYDKMSLTTHKLHLNMSNKPISYEGNERTLSII